MDLNDVGGQFVRRQVGGILRRHGLVRQFGFELLDHGVGGETLTFAGLAQGASALAAEVDVEGLEDARAPGPFGDEFADGTFEQRGSKR